MRIANPLTILRATLFVMLAVVLVATIASGEDKAPPTYQQGTIMGWDTRVDSTTHGGMGNTPVRTDNHKVKVYELKGADLIYKIDDCGAFQSGKFTAGQSVDYRVDDNRLYIRHDDNKEYKCKIDGTRAVEKTDASSTVH
jgi:hypothetical protein